MCVNGWICYTSTVYLTCFCYLSQMEQIVPHEQLSHLRQRLLFGRDVPIFENVDLRVPFPAAPGTLILFCEPGIHLNVTCWTGYLDKQALWKLFFTPFRKRYLHYLLFSYPCIQQWAAMWEAALSDLSPPIQVVWSHRRLPKQLHKSSCIMEVEDGAQLVEGNSELCEFWQHDGRRGQAAAVLLQGLWSEQEELKWQLLHLDLGRH